eukprot:scaffold4885_cov309-Prasinococcus_capsulatus_cf.AAC.2
MLCKLGEPRARCTLARGTSASSGCCGGADAHTAAGPGAGAAAARGRGAARALRHAGAPCVRRPGECSTARSTPRSSTGAERRRCWTATAWCGAGASWWRAGCSSSRTTRPSRAASAPPSSPVRGAAREATTQPQHEHRPPCGPAGGWASSPADGTRLLLVRATTAGRAAGFGIDVDEAEVVTSSFAAAAYLLSSSSSSSLSRGGVLLLGAVWQAPLGRRRRLLPVAVRPRRREREARADRPTPPPWRASPSWGACSSSSSSSSGGPPRSPPRPSRASSPTVRCARAPLFGARLRLPSACLTSVRVWRALRRGSGGAGGPERGGGGLRWGVLLLQALPGLRQPAGLPGSAVRRGAPCGAPRR